MAARVGCRAGNGCTSATPTSNSPPQTARWHKPFLPAPPEPIGLDLPDAADRVRAALLADGTALLRGTPDATRAAVLQFAAEPLDAGPVLAYPRVRGASATAGAVTVLLELAEVVHQ